MTDPDVSAREETPPGDRPPPSAGSRGLTDRALPPGTKPVLVLSKIREILDVFSADRPELTLNGIRKATGLPATTCQRLVANLVAEGFLDRTADHYRIGLSVLYWAAPASVGLDLVQTLAPVIADLRERTGETSCLYRREENFRICVGMAETHHAIRREMHVGKVMPLHAGSASRVLLAWDEPTADAVLNAPLPRYTDLTVTDPDLLRIALEQTRRQGYAITADERDAGAASVSAPVFDHEGRLVAAIGICGPTQRMTPQQCQSWGPTVLSAAKRATAVLGG
ncbi:IclR family transcriptional regulator [Streptomyces sp. NPDC050161]|uniref:IclR family transcriptional regulator n=1 Tax=Streptomyces sp. NPDC050161 TaxID=3365604 RepID=UPI0037AE9A94